MPDKPRRLLSLDVFRGVVIFMMIVVNSPGTSGQLSHAHWDGVTLADLVFPFFIFIVGLSIGIHHAKFQSQVRAKVLRGIFMRTLSLFVLGLLVNAFYTEFSSIRVLGVLQRIALVYGLCSVMMIYLSPRQMSYCGASILLAYWLLIVWVPYPGGSAGDLARGINIINWVDQQFLPGMLWRGTWDPEGVLSTFPAVVTGVLGLLFGLQIVKDKNLNTTMLHLFAIGFLLFGLGFLWSPFFPLIKQIWSSSFVLVTSGLAAMTFATFIYLLESRESSTLNNTLTQFFRIFGLNATAVYLFHVVLHYVLGLPIGGASVHDRFMQAFSPVLGASISTGGFIVLFMTACFGLNYSLYKKNVFLKL